jgi:hypothetical protein
MKRIFHHWEAWECVQAGMYSAMDIDREKAERRYARFLNNTGRFNRAMARVIRRWPISCEQFLSNDSINRIAWLGQAAMCMETGIPRIYRAGFKLLSDVEQGRANAAADTVLQLWLRTPRQMRLWI